jgi:hypothetical protein
VKSKLWNHLVMGTRVYSLSQPWAETKFFFFYLKTFYFWPVCLSPHQNCWAGQCDKNIYKRGEPAYAFLYIYFIAQYISSRCAEIRVWFHVPKGPIWRKRDPQKKKLVIIITLPDRSMYNSISVLKWPCLTHGENISGTHFVPDVYGLLFFFSIFLI